MMHPYSTRIVVSALAVAALALAPTTKATPPGHDVAAGIFNVQTIDTGDTTNSVVVTCPYSINGYRIRDGSSRADYNVQIGADATDDPATGVLMSTPYGNGYDYSAFGGGISNCISAVDRNANGWWIPTFGVMGLGGGSNPELNVNVAGAWFPYSTWIGGFVKNSGNTNGGQMNVLTGNANLTLDTNDVTKGYYIDLGGGKSIIDLRNLGYDSRVDGVLLATGCKNESANYGSTSVNSDGTWETYVHDDGGNNSSFEQDPVAFVFIPKTNTTIISGRFDGAGNILAFSGNAPQFTVTSNAAGVYELKPIGKSAVNGVLIVSPEVTLNAVNADNFVSYALNGNQDGWIIQSHDCPAGGLEQIPADIPVCSFAFIPGGTPGISATPTNNIFTTESGGTTQFNVVLDYQPTADVTFSVTSSNPNEGTTDVSSLTFTTDNWSIPQTVTVTGVDDAVADGTVYYTIDFGAASSGDPSYNGVQPASVTVGNIDNEPGITVVPSSGLTTTESGGTATFVVHLNSQPTDTVTFTLASSNPNEGTVSPASLTFDGSNWSQDQTVTVTGVDDVVVDGNVSYTIITGTAQSNDPIYNGVNPVDVSLVNLDNDVAGLNISAAGPDGLSVVEGRSTNYTVSLATQPTQNVTVNISSSDTAQGGTVTPPSLTFTPANWNTPQAVSVTASDDLAVDGTTDWSISHSVSSTDSAYAAVAPEAVLMHTLDNEPTITLPSGTLIYGTGVGALGVDGLATVSDPNTINYAGTTLRVTITNNAAGDDQLSVRNDGSNPGQIGVSGNAVSYGGTQIATFTAASGSSPLVITFNAAATAAAVQATLRNVTFQNANPSASQALRSVLVVLAHADGGAGSAATTVRVSLLRYTEFQEGADHGYGAYTGENDIELRQNAPNTVFPAGNASGLFIDWPDAGSQNQSEVLLRFDNIFGDGPGQIPSNAVVVEAQLIFHVNDQGDGSPLYRMTQDWDATNLTWNTDGIVIGSQSQPVADSVWGLPDGSGNTFTNTAVISVLPDMLAWLNGGEENHGWVMPGWNGNTDGTGFSPGEDATVTNRPDLRILWLPPGVSSNSFRQNVNGYTGQSDTEIRGSDPTNTALATYQDLFVDWTVTNPGDQSQVLIKFDNIIGTGPGQIPPGSQVHAAVLDLASQGNLAQGQGGAFHMMLMPWQDTDTWDTLGGTGITNDNVQASSAISAAAGSSNLDTLVQGAFLSYELTADVAQWVSGAKPNYGWVILPWVNGGDGWAIGTAENATETYRPMLRVYYTPASVQATITISSVQRSSTTAVINFTGAPNTTYSVVRSATVHGTYSSVGPVTTDANGAGTFTDNAPPAGAAFYQISNP